MYNNVMLTSENNINWFWKLNCNSEFCQLGHYLNMLFCYKIFLSWKYLSSVSTQARTWLVDNQYSVILWFHEEFFLL